MGGVTEVDNGSTSITVAVATTSAAEQHEEFFSVPAETA